MEIATATKNVLILDEQTAFMTSLGTSFSQAGFTTWIHSTLQVDSVHAAAGSFDLIVTEQRVAGTSVFDAVDDLRRCVPEARVSIVTAYPSVARAVQAIRMGIDAYLAKPVTATCILQALRWGEERTGVCRDADVPVDTEPQWATLDRTIWEYLNHVYATAGSMGEAARRLGLDRRSLRRMLAKYPPLK